MDIAGNAPINQLQQFGDTERQAIDGLRQAIEQLGGGLQDLLEIVKSMQIANDLPDDNVNTRFEKTERRLTATVLDLDVRTQKIESWIEKTENRLAHTDAKMGRIDEFQAKMVGFEASLAVNRDLDREHDERIKAIESPISSVGDGPLDVLRNRIQKLERSLRLNGIPNIG